MSFMVLVKPLPFYLAFWVNKDLNQTYMNAKKT